MSYVHADSIENSLLNILNEFDVIITKVIITRILKYNVFDSYDNGNKLVGKTRWNLGEARWDGFSYPQQPFVAF